MARYRHGGRPGDFTVADPGTTANVVTIAPSAAGTVWSAETGGVQYTDLQTLAGAPTTGITSDARGTVVGFFGPDEVRGVWADFGSGRVWLDPITFPAASAVAVGGVQLAGDLGGTATAPTVPGLAGKVAKGSLVFNVKDYGALGDGVADDTAAIQACIDAAIGGTPAGGATVARLALGIVFLPAGIYKVTAPLKIYSVQGFTMLGTGEGTQIAASGTYGKVLEINGSLRGLFADFLVIGYNGWAGASVTSAVALDWDPAIASQSSSGNMFSRVVVRNLTYVYAFGIGLDTANRQTDNTGYYDCSVEGNWAAGNVTTFQAAYWVGNGAWGNILNHNFYSCSASYNRYNWRAYSITGFSVHGGSSGAAEVDFFLAIGASALVDTVRCESSTRMITTGINAATATLTVRECSFQSSAVAADGQVIQFGYPGSIIIDNVFMSPSVNVPVTYRATCTAGSPSIAQVIVRGGASATPVDQLVTANSASTPFVATITGYTRLDPSTGLVVTTTPHLVYDRTTTIAVTPSVKTVTASYTVLPADDVVVGNGTSITVTLPDPTTVSSKPYGVKNINSTALTVNSAGTSRTIDGAASQSLAQWAKATYVSDGTQWLTV